MSFMEHRLTTLYTLVPLFCIFKWDVLEKIHNLMRITIIRFILIIYYTVSIENIIISRNDIEKNINICQMAYIRGRRGLRLVFNMLQQRVVGQRVITERSQHKARTFKKSQIVMFYFVSTIKSINIAYTISLHSTAYSHIL